MEWLDEKPVNQHQLYPRYSDSSTRSDISV